VTADKTQRVRERVFEALTGVSTLKTVRNCLLGNRPDAATSGQMRPDTARCGQMRPHTLAAVRESVRVQSIEVLHTARRHCKLEGVTQWIVQSVSIGRSRASALLLQMLNQSPELPHCELPVVLIEIAEKVRHVIRQVVGSGDLIGEKISHGHA
jgi:hypothetical protein